MRTPRPSGELRLRLGPHDDGAAYVVGNESNRIGLRLEGERVRWRSDRELPTGGYFVIGVVDPDDLAICAQLQPGDRITFRVTFRVTPLRA